MSLVPRRTGVPISTIGLPLLLVSVNSAGPSRIDAALALAKVMSIQPRLLKSTVVIFWPLGGLSRPLEVVATVNSSASPWLEMPLVSRKVPGRIVSVYLPTARLPVNE